MIHERFFSRLYMLPYINIRNAYRFILLTIKYSNKNNILNEGIIKQAKYGDNHKFEYASFLALSTSIFYKIHAKTIEKQDDQKYPTFDENDVKSIRNYVNHLYDSKKADHDEVNLKGNLIKTVICLKSLFKNENEIEKIELLLIAIVNITNKLGHYPKGDIEELLLELKLHYLFKDMLNFYINTKKKYSQTNKLLNRIFLCLVNMTFLKVATVEFIKSGYLSYIQKNS